MLLSDLPLDVLLASVLPQLDVMSLLALSATCRSFRELVTGDLAEPLWHGRLVRDLNFPAASSARTAGWYDLYRRVASSTTYTWGETRNHRLGIDQNRLHSLIGQQPDRDGIYAPTAVHLPATVVALCAGGWCVLGVRLHIS
jgi:SCF-associated factor 1